MTAADNPVVVTITATRSPATTHIRTNPEREHPVYWYSYCNRKWKSGYNRVVITPASIKTVTCERCRTEWQSRIDKQSAT